jgi:hypothetical protein
MCSNISHVASTLLSILSFDIPCTKNNLYPLPIYSYYRMALELRTGIPVMKQVLGILNANEYGKLLAPPLCLICFTLSPSFINIFKKY